MGSSQWTVRLYQPRSMQGHEAGWTDSLRDANMVADRREEEIGSGHVVYKDVTFSDRGCKIVGCPDSQDDPDGPCCAQAEKFLTYREADFAMGPDKDGICVPIHSARSLIRACLILPVLRRAHSGERR